MQDRFISHVCTRAGSVKGLLKLNWIKQSGKSFHADQFLWSVAFPLVLYSSCSFSEWGWSAVLQEMSPESKWMVYTDSQAPVFCSIVHYVDHFIEIFEVLKIQLRLNPAPLFLVGDTLDRNLLQLLFPWTVTIWLVSRILCPTCIQSGPLFVFSICKLAACRFIFVMSVTLSHMSYDMHKAGFRFDTHFEVSIKMTVHSMNLLFGAWLALLYCLQTWFRVGLVQFQIHMYHTAVPPDFMCHQSIDCGSWKISSNFHRTPVLYSHHADGKLFDYCHRNHGHCTTENFTLCSNDFRASTQILLRFFLPLAVVLTNVTSPSSSDPSRYPTCVASFQTQAQISSDQIHIFRWLLLNVRNTIKTSRKDEQRVRAPHVLGWD